MPSSSIRRVAPLLRLGLDLGGTKIEGAILDQRGRQLFRERVATGQEGGYRAILANVEALYRRMLREIGTREHGLGLGAPGSLSYASGRIKNSSTPCLNGKPLKRDLERRLGRSLVLENDANCFALAEALQGAGRGHEMVFGVILGTGCGGGIVCQGRLWRGAQGIAGEWGHSSIDPEGPRCYCGQRGCVETVVSGGELEKRYRERHGRALGLREIVRRFRAGKPEDAAFMSEFFERFGRSLANVINILDPDVVVLGGGVSNIRELYGRGVRETRRRIFNDRPTTPIVRHRLGDSAGVIGAALLSDQGSAYAFDRDWIKK